MTEDLNDCLIVFDWNGTIMDDSERAARATNTVLTARGQRSLDIDEFRATFTLPLREWLTDLGVASTDAAAAENEWNAAMEAEAPVRPAARSVLVELRGRGARLGVASAAGAAAVQSDVRRAGLGDVLDFVATGVADKAAFLRSRREERARALYVGDTAYDMHSARTAGYRAVAITGGYQSAALLAAAKPDAVVADLGELCTLASAGTV